MEDQTVYSAMQTGEPLARYAKTIVGKVHVVALNPFSGKPEGIILAGNQTIPEPSSYIEVWDEKSLAFFQRMNRKHFEAGRLTELMRLPKMEPSPNQLSEAEIEDLLNSPFLKLKNRVAQFTATAPLLRLVNRARELDKSEKIITFLEEAMGKLELARYEEE